MSEKFESYINKLVGERLMAIIEQNLKDIEALEKEKRIEELAKAICPTLCPQKHQPYASCFSARCDIVLCAKNLYDAGYRKQSDVARAILDELYTEADQEGTAGEYLYGVRARIVELRKKYIEG